VARTDVRIAAIFSGLISLSVPSAGFRFVTGVGGIGWRFSSGRMTLVSYGDISRREIPW
jgi:hypothetical protein